MAVHGLARSRPADTDYDGGRIGSSHRQLHGLGPHRVLLRGLRAERARAKTARSVRSSCWKWLLAQGAPAAFLETLLSCFRRLGYDVDVHTALAANYRVPQLRKRIFVVGLPRELQL